MPKCRSCRVDEEGRLVPCATCDTRFDAAMYRLYCERGQGETETAQTHRARAGIKDPRKLH